MSELHERLIEELLSGKVSLTPRENAAANEIRNLRAELEKAKAKKLPKKDQE